MCISGKGELMNGIIQIITTIDSKDKIEKIGRHLLERRLVSSVQIIGPIKSIYWWKGKIEEAEEWACVMKSKKSLYTSIEKEIKKLHTYELPEIIAIDIDNALSEYTNWVLSETITE
jgi:periplasmic divalent cation tolerance protein